VGIEKKKQTGAAVSFVLSIALISIWPSGAMSQGVAVPNRGARPRPDVKLNVPVPQVRFEDVAPKAGLTAQHVTGNENRKDYIIETTGSGVALIDYDNDGWLDVFLVNGTTIAGFPKGQEPTNHLYRNNKDGTFSDVTEGANLVRSGWGQGACVGDFDNDGFDDLMVTYFGQNVLYKNEGNGRFADVTAKAGLLSKNTRWGTGCSFLDYDKDGKLDLFVANYVDFDIAKTPAKGSSRFCMWKGVPVMCGPRGLPAGTNLLYHNNGDGTFTDVSEKSGIAAPKGRYSFTSLVTDYDVDGWPDIYVACDSTPNILYHNERNGRFVDAGLMSGTALSEDGQEQAGMGLSGADYDHDGFIDFVKTNFIDDTSTLYRNNGDGTFTDATFPSRLGVNTRFLGWGTGFFDLDNDGWKDIFMVNGHVYPEADTPARQQRLIYWNLRDGTFADISAQMGAGITAPRCSRGAALGDLDNDGNLEIVINNINDTPSLLKSSGPKNNWTMIKTIGRRSNRNGIGARVTVVAGKVRQVDEVRSGGSYISQNDLRLHFGLGDVTKIDRIDVTWPSGGKDRFENLKVNQLVVLEEGKGVAVIRTGRTKSSRRQ
jgi:hypothetical protein